MHSQFTAKNTRADSFFHRARIISHSLSLLVHLVIHPNRTLGARHECADRSSSTKPPMKG